MEYFNGRVFPWWVYSKVLELLKTMIKVDKESPNVILPPNKYVLSIVLSCCAENGLLSEDMDGVVTVFDWVPGSDICTYNTILTGLFEHGYFIEALDCLSEMVNKSMEWDGVTYATCFCLSARLKDLKLGLQIHAKLLKSLFMCDMFVNSAIIDMYGKCSKILMAKKLFDSLKLQNVVSWTAILTAYLQN